MRTMVCLFLLFNMAAVEAVSENLIKKEILSLTSQLERGLEKKEASEAWFRLALAYEKDQEQDKAFLSFLEALKTLPLTAQKDENCLPTEKEVAEALNYYIQEVTQNPIEGSKSLIEKYSSTIVSAHPLLKLIIAAAHANLGEYALFFNDFYDAYPAVGDTFLSYKIQAILYLKLSQREPSGQKKSMLQLEALNLLQKALEKRATDASVYKILAGLAKERGEDGVLFNCLHGLVANDVSFQRSDLFWYVQEAVDLEAYELAQELIDHAHQKYSISKAVDAAQQYLNQFKNG